MATIQLTTNNYNGEQGNVYFFPCNSGANATFLGTHTFPYEIVDTENYEGTYQIGFTGLTSGINQFCYVQIPCSGCNRPTGLTTTALWVDFNGTDITSSANAACDALTELNNGNNFLGGNLTAQIGPDNKVYKTEILGDCAVISEGYYIITDNLGNRIISIDSSGYYTDMACVNLPTSTPTPTPMGPTDTPTPTPIGSTSTPTPTPMATDTPTPTPIGSTSTPTPTPMATDTPTPTPFVPTATPTPEPPTATPTPNPTDTPTPTPFVATSTPTPTPEPATTYAVQIAAGVGGPSGTACQDAQSMTNMFTVYSLFNNGGQLSTSTETLYADVSATVPYNGHSSVYSDGTAYGTINSSGVFVFQGYCSGI